MSGEIFQHTRQKANKEYQCYWCGETITRGWFYDRWRYKTDGEVMTLKVHAECKCAWSDAAEIEGGIYETGPAEHERGCDCESGECRCGRTRKEKLTRHCVTIQKGKS